MTKHTDVRDGVHEPIGDIVLRPPKQSLAKSETELAKAAQLEALESRIFHKCLTVVEDALCCVDLDPANPKATPPEWNAELGGDQDAIERRRRTAMAASVPSKDCPAGIQMAKSVAIGIMRSRGQREPAHNQLNVNVVTMGVSPATYPSIVVGNNED